MEVNFHVSYHTAFGQTVSIVGDHESFGKWNSYGGRRMDYIGDGNWKLTFIFPETTQSFSYRYILTSGDWSLSEYGANRLLSFGDLKGFSSVHLEDKWRAPDSYEVSPHINASLFTSVVFGRENAKVTSVPALSSVKGGADTVVVKFQIHAVFVPPNGSVRVSGEASALGKWNLKAAPVLSSQNYPFWEGVVQVSRKELPSTYKFVICGDNGDLPSWEDGGNRTLSPSKEQLVIVNTTFAKEMDYRGAGVAIPVFSLRTTKSCGVGEFLDLKLMFDWASGAGLRLVQILPINDTTVRGDWRDSYPYSALSVFALHPMYIHLPGLTKDAAILKEISEQSKKLNALPEIDYELTLEFKKKIMEKVYQTEKGNLAKDADFQTWLKKNDWLPSYALFSTFKDRFETSDYSQWGKFREISKEEIAKLTAPSSEYYDRVLYYYYVQYNLHLQLKEAADYAATKHVGIKGDIAIGVNPKCVDTWTNPKFFRLSKQTGAPPDFFSEEGQNWGFPTYNWDEMAKDDYSWWRTRLRSMAQYFHAFRIDHILGFFRIWEIPGHGVSGLLGRFYPSIPVWKDEILSRGMWDIKRLIEPYIRLHLVQRLFGEHTQQVIEKYLESTGEFSFKLKPEVSTEKGIVAALPIDDVSKDIAAHHEWLRKALMRLVQNVCLLRDDDDENKYYPRIEMHKTSSWNELPDWQKDALYKIYVDYFYNRQEGLCTQTALQRLPVMINSTKMLCCGEDLGMVPKCVEPVMNKLKILGLRVQRMSDDPKKEFQHPSDYGYMIVCTPSVHDTSTTRGWWEEDYATSQRFWNQCLGQGGSAPRFATEDVSAKIISQHLWSRAMWTIFPLQDLFGLHQPYFENRDPQKERINIPAIPEHYWRYRMHVTLEDLVKDKDFALKVKSLCHQSGRTY